MAGQTPPRRPCVQVVNRLGSRFYSQEQARAEQAAFDTLMASHLGAAESALPPWDAMTTIGQRYSYHMLQYAKTRIALAESDESLAVRSFPELRRTAHVFLAEHPGYARFRRVANTYLEMLDEAGESAGLAREAAEADKAVFTETLLGMIEANLPPRDRLRTASRKMEAYRVYRNWSDYYEQQGDLEQATLYLAKASEVARAILDQHPGSSFEARLQRAYHDTQRVLGGSGKALDELEADLQTIWANLAGFDERRLFVGSLRNAAMATLREGDSAAFARYSALVFDRALALIDEDPQHLDAGLVVDTYFSALRTTPPGTLPVPGAARATAKSGDSSQRSALADLEGRVVANPASVLEFTGRYILGYHEGTLFGDHAAAMVHLERMLAMVDDGTVDRLLGSEGLTRRSEALIQLLIGHCCLATGRTEEAKAQYDFFVQSYPDTPGHVASAEFACFQAERKLDVLPMEELIAQQLHFLTDHGDHPMAPQVAKNIELDLMRRDEMDRVHEPWMVLARHAEAPEDASELYAAAQELRTDLEDYMGALALRDAFLAERAEPELRARVLLVSEAVFFAQGDKEGLRALYRRIVGDYPGTPEAEQAQISLDALDAVQQ